MEKFEKKGYLLNVKDGFQNAVKDFFRQNRDVFEAVMLPMKVPSGDSYAWILIKDDKYFEKAVSISPLMPVNAAQAVKRFTRKGEAGLKTAFLIRPCEVRAVVELKKLNQVQLDNVVICSYDCPGAIPMQEYIEEPEAKEKLFAELLQNGDWNSDIVKPVCRMCEDFSVNAGDLHFAFDDNNIYLLAGSKKGEDIMSELNLKPDKDLDNWQKKIDAVRTKRQKEKDKQYSEMKGKVEGFENLLATFAECIGCHNCQSACPICYCRQCYFDSPAAKPHSDVIMLRAEKRGGLSLPLDRLMFHTGRMSHMSLSCVSCGLCSDACPVNIPVASIFSYVGSQTQSAFEYTAGVSFGDALPLREYKEEELSTLTALIKEVENGEVADE